MGAIEQFAFPPIDGLLLGAGPHDSRDEAGYNDTYISSTSPTTDFSAATGFKVGAVASTGEVDRGLIYLRGRGDAGIDGDRPHPPRALSQVGSGVTLSCHPPALGLTANPIA